MMRILCNRWRKGEEMIEKVREKERDRYPSQNGFFCPIGLYTKIMHKRVNLCATTIIVAFK